jgi:hypothetical protein
VFRFHQAILQASVMSRTQTRWSAALLLPFLFRSNLSTPSSLRAGAHAKFLSLTEVSSLHRIYTTKTAGLNTITNKLMSCFFALSGEEGKLCPDSCAQKFIIKSRKARRNI